MGEKEVDEESERAAYHGYMQQALHFNGNIIKLKNGTKLYMANEHRRAKIWLYIKRSQYSMYCEDNGDIETIELDPPTEEEVYKFKNWLTKIGIHDEYGSHMVISVREY